MIYFDMNAQPFSHPFLPLGHLRVCCQLLDVIGIWLCDFRYLHSIPFPLLRNLKITSALSITCCNKNHAASLIFTEWHLTYRANMYTANSLFPTQSTRICLLTIVCNGMSKGGALGAEALVSKNHFKIYSPQPFPTLSHFSITPIPSRVKSTGCVVYTEPGGV